MLLCLAIVLLGQVDGFHGADMHSCSLGGPRNGLPWGGGLGITGGFRGEATASPAGRGTLWMRLRGGGAPEDGPSPRRGRGGGRGGRGGERGRGRGGRGSTVGVRKPLPYGPTSSPLEDFMGEEINVQCSGGREFRGTMSGYDLLGNICMDNTTEYMMDRDDDDEWVWSGKTRKRASSPPPNFGAPFCCVPVQSAPLPRTSCRPALPAQILSARGGGRA